MVRYACYLFEGASMAAIMLNHMTIVYTEPKREDRPPSPTVEERQRESIITGLIIRLDDDDHQAIDSHRLAAPNNDAGEGSEQDRVRPASLDSDDSDQDGACGRADAVAEGRVGQAEMR